jgi:hypothetical protein
MVSTGVLIISKRAVFLDLGYTLMNWVINLNANNKLAYAA